MKILRYARVYLCVTLVWAWTLVWGIGLSIAFFFIGHRRNFLPRAIRIHSGPALWISGIHVTIENEKVLYAHEPCIILGNHQSGFDVPIFGGFCPDNLVWIAKKELGSLPFIGWVLKRTGNILIDRKQREKAFRSIKEAANRMIHEKRNVCVLPEGTRNPNSDAMLPFKRGPFHLAKAADAPMIPVVCSSLKTVANMKTGRLGGKVILRVLPLVLPQGTPDEMAVQLRTIMQAAYEELNRELGI